MSWLSHFGLKHWRVTVFFILVAMVSGALNFFNMGAREDPFLLLRSGIVIANHEGLPAEQIEELVAKPIEARLREVAEVQEIKTTIEEGRATFQIEFYYGFTELDQIWDEVAEAVELAKPDLPSTVGSIIVDDEFSDVAVITLAVTSDSFSHFEQLDYVQTLRDRLALVPGTNRVDIVGAVPREIIISADPNDLQASGVSLGSISTTLQRFSALTASGEIVTNGRRYLIDANDSFLTLDDIRSLPLDVAGQTGVTTRLDSIFDVSEGYVDPFEEKAYFNGRQAIVLSIIMEPSENTLRYSERAQIAIDEEIAQLPLGLDVNFITVQANEVEKAVYGVGLSVLATLAIVIGVVVLFLGLRTGLLVGSIIPVVMLTTITVMALTGIQLQRMSLATLVISLGLLVDNAIVIVDAYQRRVSQGLAPKLAAQTTVKTLGLPLLTSSLTTMVFFLPLALAADPSGEYTRSISQVVIISLSISWMASMLLMPVLCVKFAAPSKSETSKGIVQKIIVLIEDRYGRLLSQGLRFRWLICTAMIGAFALGGYMIGTSPQQFFPSSDRSQILIYVDLPQGSSTLDSDQAVQRIMETLNDNDKYAEVQNYAAYVGFGGPRFVLSLEPVDASANVAFIVASISASEHVEPYVSRLQSDLEKKAPEATIRVSKMFLGPSDPNVIQVQVKGDDAPIILSASEQVTQLLSQQDGFQYATSDWYNPVDRLQVNIDREQAIALGLSPSEVSSQLDAVTRGTALSRFFEDDDRVAIRVRSTNQGRFSLNNLRTIPITSPINSDPISLSSLASIDVVPGYGRIQREDAVRTVTIESRNARLSPEEVAPMISEGLAIIDADLPAGHSIEFDGAVEDGIKSQTAIAANAPLALFLIMLLLLFQFQSLRNALIVIATLPVSVFGAGIGLKVMNAPFGFMVILGLFALFGIIVNNAIVLIDRFDQLRDSASQFNFTTIRLGAVERLRPILIASTTTVLGLLPLIWTKDVLFFGLAVVVAFGLAIGTIVTLFFVPSLYAIIHKSAEYSEYKKT